MDTCGIEGSTFTSVSKERDVNSGPGGWHNSTEVLRMTERQQQQTPKQETEEAAETAGKEVRRTF